MLQTKTHTLYEAVDHIDTALSLITDHGELHNLCELNLKVSNGDRK